MNNIPGNHTRTMNHDQTLTSLKHFLLSSYEVLLNADRTARKKNTIKRMLLNADTTKTYFQVILTSVHTHTHTHTHIYISLASYTNPIYGRVYNSLAILYIYITLVSYINHLMKIHLDK